MSKMEYHNISLKYKFSSGKIKKCSKLNNKMLVKLNIIMNLWMNCSNLLNRIKNFSLYNVDISIK